MVHTLNFGNFIITGSIKHIHPGLTFGISLIYATILLLVAYFLPRYQGGHKSCIRQSLSKTMDPTDQEYRADTLAYLSEGGLSVNTNSWNHEIVARDVPNPNFYSPIMLFVGAVIGVTVVLGIFLHQIFGESTTFSWLAGRLFLPHYAYSTKVFGKIGWEPLSDIGTFFGAFIAALFISRRFNAFRPVIPPSWRNRFGTNLVTRAIGAFVGSFLVLFGARMADGCASGHILSGGVQMAVSAWIFTIAVLIAMIITAKWVYGNASEKVNPAHESPSHPQRRVLP